MDVLQGIVHEIECLRKINGPIHKGVEKGEIAYDTAIDDVLEIVNGYIHTEVPEATAEVSAGAKPLGLSK